MNKKRVSIIVLVIGLIALVAGVIFLIISLNKGPELGDGEYLVSAKHWVLKDEDSVVWDFTEIGKGKLTTNNHVNDYDFIWALEDGKLKIETDWLYDLENEYVYRIDKGAGTLTLTDTEDEETATFVRVEGGESSGENN